MTHNSVLHNILHFKKGLYHVSKIILNDLMTFRRIIIYIFWFSNLQTDFSNEVWRDNIFNVEHDNLDDESTIFVCVQ